MPFSLALCLALAAAADGGSPHAYERALQKGAHGAFWGVALVAVDGGVVYAKAAGNADYDVQPITLHTEFEIASLSKQFTATAVLKLEQQGKLKTQDSLAKYLPGVPPDKRGITVDHLLHHTAGLSPELGVPYVWQGTRDEYLRTVLKPKLVRRPGSKYEYSNVGYARLAALVEVTSGQTFEDYVRQELFAPAGLTQTGFIQDPHRLASPHGTLRHCPNCEPTWTAANWFIGWGYRGMGGVVTTAVDLLAWDRALRGDRIVGEVARLKLFEDGLGHSGCGSNVELHPNGAALAYHTGGVRASGRR